jgi:hypothetical protein
MADSGEALTGRATDNEVDITVSPKPARKSIQLRTRTSQPLKIADAVLLSVDRALRAVAKVGSHGPGVELGYEDRLKSRLLETQSEATATRE